MIGTLTIDARIRVSVTRQGIHIRTNVGTVTGFTKSGDVQYLNDKTKTILRSSPANCRVIKPATTDANQETNA